MFDLQSREEISNRIKTELKTNLQSEVSTAEGTFSSDMIQANSLEFTKAYTELNMLHEAAFADTSWGEYLTMRAAEFGVNRKEATKAIGEITIKGNIGAKIIKNSLFATNDDTNFYTTKDGVIGLDGTVKIGIEAKSAGEEGNVDAGTIIKIPMSIPGVYEVINEAATHDGFKEESDEALLARYLLKVRTPATSGNKYHYLNWALSIEGVGNAKILPLWEGAGTVKVIIVNAENKTASKDLVQKTAAYIETVRPIGATVTISTAISKLINISADIIGEFDLQEVKNKINEYFKTLGFEINSVSIARVGKLILECGGVEDYTNLKLNGGKENIALNEEELPTLGELNFNVSISA